LLAIELTSDAPAFRSVDAAVEAPEETIRM
jgi:hypothetical protein